MSRSRLTDNKLVWCLIVIVAEASGSLALNVVVGMSGLESVGKALTSATVFLSVTVAVVVQLWAKLNDLSALPSLTATERKNLWMLVGVRVRGLVSLVIFFVLFTFFLLLAAAVANSGALVAAWLLSGVGAGFGATAALLAAVLIDLNEVAQFRWQVETSDHIARRATRAISDLRKPEAGFEDDDHVQGYKRVVNGDENKS